MPSSHCPLNNARPSAQPLVLELLQVLVLLLLLLPFLVPVLLQKRRVLAVRVAWAYLQRCRPGLSQPRLSQRR